MDDVRGDVLRPPYGTTPAAVKSNIKSEMRSFKSNENIHKKTLFHFSFLQTLHRRGKVNLKRSCLNTLNIFYTVCDFGLFENQVP